MPLTPSQLADLVNYVLRLPVRVGGRITVPGIGPWIVSSWTKKHKLRAALWCEEVLVHADVLPGEKVRTGPRRSAPKGLLRIAPQPVGCVEQVREYRRRVG